MNRLPIDYINENAPYRVTLVSDDEVQFTTRYGVECRVGFMQDYSIWDDNAYQFLINNKNHKSSPNDNFLKETIFAIIDAFFISNPHILLYICETGDSKQSARNRLFVRWFHESKSRESFYFKDVCVYADGIENFAALIVQRSNPDLETIVQQFDEFVDLMSNKPDDTYNA